MLNHILVEILACTSVAARNWLALVSVNHGFFVVLDRRSSLNLLFNLLRRTPSILSVDRCVNRDIFFLLRENYRGRFGALSKNIMVIRHLAM